MPMSTASRPLLLVTGGSGYLGQQLIRLGRERWQVAATYHAHPEAATSLTHRLDLTDATGVVALCLELRPTVIIHTAAANPGSGQDFTAVNVLGTRHVAQAAATCGARLIYLSTDMIFDGRQGNYTESAAPNPVTEYGRSKAEAEAEVRASGAEAVSVRTSLIYGWQPTLDRQSRWIIDSLRSGAPLHLFTNELRCPIWVESLAAALLELTALDYTGVLNVAGAETLSRYAFGVQLARFHGLDPAPIIPADSRGYATPRPADCSLDCARARALLRTPLPGVAEILSGSRGDKPPL